MVAGGKKKNGYRMNGRKKKKGGYEVVDSVFSAVEALETTETVEFVETDAAITRNVGKKGGEGSR